MLELVPSWQLGQETNVDVTPIRLVDGSQLSGVSRGGVVDIPQAGVPSGSIVPLAHYIDSDVLDLVAIRASVGRGAAAFWGAHIETPITSDLAQEKMRLQALRITLKCLGLQLPEEISQGPVIALGPTPQILTGAPCIVETIIRALHVPKLSSAAPYMFKDRYDTFLFHPQEVAPRVFAQQRGAVNAPRDDSGTWNPKHIMVYSDNGMPPKELMPKFDMGAYYRELKSARNKYGCRVTYRDSTWGVGEALLYGNVVTSTQTMLDK